MKFTDQDKKTFIDDFFKCFPIAKKFAIDRIEAEYEEQASFSDNMYSREHWMMTPAECEEYDEEVEKLAAEHDERIGFLQNYSLSAVDLEINIEASSNFEEFLDRIHSDIRSYLKLNTIFGYKYEKLTGMFATFKEFYENYSLPEGLMYRFKHDSKKLSQQIELLYELEKENLISFSEASEFVEELLKECLSFSEYDYNGYHNYNAKRIYDFLFECFKNQKFFNFLLDKKLVEAFDRLVHYEDAKSSKNVYAQNKIETIFDLGLKANENNLQNLKELETIQLLGSFSSSMFEEKQIQELQSLIQSNDFAKNRLKEILDSHLEKEYDFESLMNYLKKKEKKSILNI